MEFDVQPPHRRSGGRWDYRVGLDTLFGTFPTFFLIMLFVGFGWAW
ncbi:hypothetical protein H9L15_13030 [Sphingomonas daechungensis]|uniref:Uncharacterized protein n=1 Tax=Sphingomonas daechungensis TaxID=1176646 RepID=A0ABX6SZD0_9SPHN|nr:hypothetical protein [Sphingomonas daechungensis]QNP42932.1 hypothetical protein H9L15_13030 [Sphingomonas daechungensis]